MTKIIKSKTLKMQKQCFCDAFLITKDGLRSILIMSQKKKNMIATVLTIVYYLMQKH